VLPKKTKSDKTPSTLPLQTNGAIPSTPSENVTGRLRLSSWNINGMRAFVKVYNLLLFLNLLFMFQKDGLAYVKRESPDIMVFQETKCGLKDLPAEVKDVPGYHTYFQVSSF
jgi:hypothetical protein